MYESLLFHSSSLYFFLSDPHPLWNTTRPIDINFRVRCPPLEPRPYKFRVMTDLK